MIKVGLTGGIGSGKSIVAKILRTMGIPVIDADIVAKTIMEKDEELIIAVKQAFGAESYIDGKLNRKYIANIVFNDDVKLGILNGLTHPATIKAAEEWMAQQTSEICVKEAALLFEVGTADDLDYIIGVKAPDAMRIQRIMQRDNMLREEVLARMDKQIDQEIKMWLCDYVIVNDGQQLLIPQVIEILDKLMKEEAALNFVI